MSPLNRRLAFYKSLLPLRKALRPTLQKLSRNRVKVILSLVVLWLFINPHSYPLYWLFGALAFHTQHPPLSLTHGCAKANTSLPVALVIPLIPSQTNRVQWLLTRWANKSFIPCMTSPRRLTHLAIYYDLSPDDKKTNESVHQIWKTMSHRSVSSTINRCFDRVYVTYANMTKRDSRNSHVLNPVTNLISTRGSNLHFESAFKTFANTYSHMMLLEPDTYPVKASWLDAMLSETYTEHWHIGARMIYSPRFNLGYMPYRDWYQRHINGNGVYKLNDACYSTFRKLVRDSYGDKAYDVSTAYYLQSWRNVRVMQSIGWRFGYSGVLVDVGVIGDLQDVENVGGENVVLVHGKARFVENAWINFMRY